MQLSHLDRLEAEHARGDIMVEGLQCAVTAWQANGAERRETFELLLRVYVDGYLGHLEVEDNYVLPVAQDYLSEADWLELHAAFACHRGKLAAATLTGRQALLRRMLDKTPSARRKTVNSPS